MTKRFIDSEFMLYGAVQSFFYICWSMFGAGREVETPRRVDATLANHWASQLFASVGVIYHFELIDGQIIRLVIQTKGVVVQKIFTVDLRHNLEDYDFYNIKWVYDENCSVENKYNYTHKKVPKVF